MVTRVGVGNSGKGLVREIDNYWLAGLGSDSGVHRCLTDGYREQAHSYSGSRAT
ncbi:hypothetical protein EMIT0215P_170093 [Pseudomonas serboccidentalis]